MPFTQISKVMRQAIVAAEDRRFYEHGAWTLKGVLRAAAANLRNGSVDQGASTLTMQYVRNVLKNDPSVTPPQREAATQDTPARKLQEIRYAAELEHTCPRTRSWSATSTSPTSAPARTGSTPPASATSPPPRPS